MEKMGSLRFFSTHSIQTKSRFPKNIILVRHGESLGNVDEQAYVTTADWRIPLTEKGTFNDLSSSFFFKICNRCKIPHIWSSGVSEKKKFY